MKFQWHLRMILVVTIFLTGCNGPVSPLSNPPFGWRSPVAELLLNDTDFPKGWQLDQEFPEDRVWDPTTNHVEREFWNPEKGSAYISQSIWRAYTIEDAKAKYSKLREKPLFSSAFAPSPHDFYLEFRPPPELNYESRIADEFYIACGWVVWAYCDAMARYQNYAVELLLPLEASYQEQVSQGLAYPEIEVALRVMDGRFRDFLNSEMTPTP